MKQQLQRKAINQFPYGEAHMHIFMNGTDYKKAVADQKNGVCDRVIHAHLAEYRKRGITWLREGGDIYGTSKRTMELAPAYGITYRTPIFAIHKKGHYGAIVGRGYETMQEYRELIGDLRRQGGHFVKIMISGIMDFTHGGLTELSLADSEIRELIHIAHEEGFPVMAHTNGSQAVRAAALAGVDSIEHGNFCDEDALQALAASDAVWVPTIVTVKNLLGDGRFPEQVVKNIWEGQKKHYSAGISSEQNLLSEVMPEPIVSSTVRDFLMNTRLSGRFWKKTSRTGKSGSGTVTG
ncbi:MAG: Xaa-Pro dipeptidase [Lachnospiraceae bacterium]